MFLSSFDSIFDELSDLILRPKSWTRIEGGIFHSDATP